MKVYLEKQVEWATREDGSYRMIGYGEPEQFSIRPTGDGGFEVIHHWHPDTPLMGTYGDLEAAQDRILRYFGMRRERDPKWILAEAGSGGGYGVLSLRVLDDEAEARALYAVQKSDSGGEPLMLVCGEIVEEQHCYPLVEED